MYLCFGVDLNTMGLSQFIPKQCFCHIDTYLFFRDSSAKDDIKAQKKVYSWLGASHLAWWRVLSGPYYRSSLSFESWQWDQSKVNLDKTNWAIAVEFPAWIAIFQLSNFGNHSSFLLSKSIRAWCVISKLKSLLKNHR